MTIHLAAFASSVDLGGVMTHIAAVQDQVITTAGEDLRVPKGLAYIVGQAALIGNATPIAAQVQSPSLRAIANLDITPVISGVVFGSPPEQIMHGESPIPLVENESLNFALEATGGVATENYGLLWLSSGQIKPISGTIYTVTAKSAVTLTAQNWSNGNITFDQTLPAGSYQIVGMRARGANLVAARLVFVGGTWRPGVSAVNGLSDLDPLHARYGSLGVYGQFDATTPPTVDCLGVTDTVQEYTFDIIKVK